MTAYRTNTLLGFVANRSNFVGLDISFGNISRYFCLGNCWRTNCYCFAVDNQKWLKLSDFLVAVQELNVKRIALLDKILLSAELS